EGQIPWGSSPTGIVAINFGGEPLRNTFTSPRPPMVTYTNFPLRLLTKFTWFVIGPVSRRAFCSNGGWALYTCTLPASFSVVHISSFSGLTAMLGQNGLACSTRLIT